MLTSEAPDSLWNPRQRLQYAIEQLDHLLPGQAPILNFVHHNTLHGVQHLPFEQALETTEQITGNRAYLSEDQFRQFFARGRILEEDLEASFAGRPSIRAEESVVEMGSRVIRRRDIYRIALLYGIETITRSGLVWQLDELKALDHFQQDVPPEPRHRLLEAVKRAVGQGESFQQNRLVRDLWNACLEIFGLDEEILNPEELTHLSIRQAETLLTEFQQEKAEDSIPLAHSKMRSEAGALLEKTFADLGSGLSLRGLFLTMTGRDILDRVRPSLTRWCASYLDEGVAAWHVPDRHEGLYSVWRRLMAFEPTVALNREFSGRADVWSTHWSPGPAVREDDERSVLGEGSEGVGRRLGILADFPEQAVDAIQSELMRIGLPEKVWEGYLRRVALELPGWSGLVNWRQQHPGYPANGEAPVALMDYLAIRLLLDRFELERLGQETWGIAATIPVLKSYFQRNLSEFFVRYHLFQGQLPEYLAVAAQQLLADTPSETQGRNRWRNLADMIFTWKRSSMAEKLERHTIFRSSWRLFRLAQHLGLSGFEIRSLSREDAENLLTTVDLLSSAERGILWLCAYERRYREELFNALANNYGRGRWAKRYERPEAQIIFCMDDREEGIRRHLEELNPRLETLGAAGFFGVAMNWRGLDDTTVTPLCPVVVKPAHEVREVMRPEASELKFAYERARKWYRWPSSLFYQEIRRNLISSSALIDFFSPGALLALAGKIFFPLRQSAVAREVESRLVPEIPTRLALNALDDGTTATPENNRLGFTDVEQADRVAGFLRNTGLADGFAPLIILMGHGSSSQNNPHFAAYDCGACSGRHGGPNARVFAAMANRTEVRGLLADRGIVIPQDTWFIGAEHNTCNEEILWFDLADLPTTLNAAFDQLRYDLETARHLSAHERCRRFASAPREPSPKQALQHIAERAVDFSQIRPELGHATHAAALVGRRSLSQGAFFDRRIFLISYDPTQDPAGTILEGLLLAVGPVGAGINLEYYFSTVNNERFGCGTKVPHNVTGLFGIMEGTSSDLRTGLPRQMIEIHEAMRLQLVVEQKQEVLIAIYERQPPLQELIGNGWVHWSALDPDSGEISMFVPGQGFIPWRGEIRPLAVVERSSDWYAGHTEALPPVLIRQS